MSGISTTRAHTHTHTKFFSNARKINGHRTRHRFTCTPLTEIHNIFALLSKYLKNCEHSRTDITLNYSKRMSLTFFIREKEQGKRRKEYRVETMRREKNEGRMNYAKDRSCLYISASLCKIACYTFRTIRVLHRLRICIYMWQHSVCMHERTTILFHENTNAACASILSSFYFFLLLYTWYIRMMSINENWGVSSKNSIIQELFELSKRNITRNSHK